MNESKPSIVTRPIDPKTITPRQVAETAAISLGRSPSEKGTERLAQDIGADADSKPLHTPGPWTFAEYMETPETIEVMRKNGMEPTPMTDNGGERFVLSEAGRICLVDPTTKVKRGAGLWHKDHVRDANARLIAAAPDLLAVCVAMLKRLDLEPVESVFPGSAMRESIRAAIRKAQGGEA